MSTNRISEQDTGKLWLIGLFLVTLNIFLFYLLLEYIELLYVTIGLAVLTFLLWITPIIRLRISKKIINLNTRASIRDLIWLSRKYISINKKFILTSVIGLVLATTVISQTVLFSSSHKQESFDQFIATADTNALKIEIKELTYINDFNLWKNNINNNIQGLLDNFDYKLKSISTFAEFNFQIVSGGIIEDDEGRTVPIINMRSKILDNSTLDFLKQFPTFNKSLRFNDYNAILIIPNGVPFTPTNLTSTGGVQLLAGSAFKPSSNDSMFSFIKLNQTYIWKISNLDMNFYQRTTQLWETYDLRYAEIIEKPSILLKDGEEWELLNLVEQQLPMGARGSSLVPVGDNDGENGDYNKIITLIQIELPFLVDVSLLQLQADLNQLKNIVESWANSKSGLVSYEIDVESPFRESIQGYINFLGAFNIVLFFVAGILACVALFLLYYSLTLVEQRKSRLIAIMKNRGSSNNQIQTMLFAEAFTSAVIAISVGMILSIPWTSLTLQTSGILEFNAVRIPLSIPQSWYWRIPLIGMILSLDLNLASILSLSKTTIEEGGEAEEKKPPFWQKSYLDVILVSVSIIFWLVIRYIPIRSESMYGLLVEGFSPIMLIILIIGAPLIFARYFSAVISKIADFLWKFQGGIIALATKNMRKNKFSNARLASLLMIGIMLSFLSVITPATIELWGNENAYYDLGSDIYVQGLDSSNVTEWNKLNMPGVEGYTEIGKLTLVGGPFEQYSFLGIDPQNFDKVAFWKNDYDEKPLSSITSKITRNTSIGIQTKVRRALGLNLNQTLSIPVSTDVIRRIIVLDIVTEFEYFPDLVQTIPDEDQYGNLYPKDLPMLVNLSLVKQLNSITGGGVFGAYVKVSKGASSSLIAEQLRTVYAQNNSIVIQSIDEAKIDFFELNETKILISSLQGMLVITIIVSITAIAFFSVITLSERKKEIGVLRAFGMVRHQIFILLTTESLLLVASAIIVGGLLGSFISMNLFTFITLALGASTQQGSVPPLRLVLPWSLIIQFTSILLISSVLVAAIPAQRTAMKETGNILRED